MKATIKPHDKKSEFYTEERCHITELSNTIDDPDVSIAQARVSPGITTRWHRLKDTVERYYIMSGEGIMELDGLKKQLVKAGDIVIIPAGCRQRITNTSDSDLLFLAICSPRFCQENYQDAEEAQ